MEIQELPEEFVRRLSAIVPKDRFESVLKSFTIEKSIAFRINTLADSRDKILARLSEIKVPLEPVPWLLDRDCDPLAFQTRHSNREKITYSPMNDAGEIYVQNLSSMLAPLVLDPQPGETILDLAAAPGGKTIQLAQQMQNQGVLSAVEVVRNRMYKLQANLKRCHVKIAKTYLTDGRTVGQKTPERFDRVLLDAPCSSEARFRAGNPKSWATWSERKIRETSRKQIGLLKAAIHAAKIGGQILYCTCSFSPEENEQVVHKVLRKFGNAIQVESIELPAEFPDATAFDGLTVWNEKSLNAQVKNCCRILPSELLDAFFLAKIRKIGSTRS